MIVEGETFGELSFKVKIYKSINFKIFEFFYF